MSEDVKKAPEGARRDKKALKMVVEDILCVLKENEITYKELKDILYAIDYRFSTLAKI